MDAAGALAIARTLYKLAEFATSAWEAARGPGIGDADLRALDALVDAARAARRIPPQRTPDVARRHLAMVTAAFFAAWRRHWAYHPDAAPDGTARWPWRRGSRSAQVERALADAALELARPGDGSDVGELHAVDALAGSPLTTGWYRGLWAAFTAPTAPDRVPLLVLEGEGRRAFERHFLLAWWELLASAAGEPVRRWLLELEGHRAVLVRDLLVARLAGVDGDGVWVEPRLTTAPAIAEDADDDEPDDDGTVWEDDDAPPAADAPTPAALRDAVAAHPFVVVEAPFGAGKTTLARRFVAELARAWLTEEVPSPDVALPVWVTGADDVVRADLRDAIGRAGRRRLGELVLLKASDPALAPPPPEQHAVLVVDGPEESPLGARELETWLHTLAGEATDRHRVVVFARPGAVPARVGGHRLSLAPLDDASVAAFVEQWSRVSLAHTDVSVGWLAERGLLERARTPLVLSLILGAGGEVADDEAAIYEAFFRALVARHAPVSRIEARLRALARLGWELQRARGEGRAVGEADVARWLGIEDEAERRASRLALPLVGDGDALRFAHRSYEAFLAGRFFADTVAALATGERHDEDVLHGVPLVGRDRAAVDFAVARLAGHPARDAVVRWAARLVADGRVAVPPGGGVADDRRAPLRHAALAIGCALADGFVLDDPAALRGLFAVDVAAGELTPLVAPRLRAPGVALDRLALPDAALPGLVAPGATLVGADLWRADLRGAVLDDAQAAYVNLDAADVAQASLVGADLYRALARDATFDGARLDRVVAAEWLAAGASFVGARLAGADLTGADLRGADLTDADLTDADLDGADLTDAELTGATLTGANLTDAIVTEAQIATARHV